LINIHDTTYTTIDIVVLSINSGFIRIALFYYFYFYSFLIMFVVFSIHFYMMCICLLLNIICLFIYLFINLLIFMHTKHACKYYRSFRLHGRC